jgi:phosphatidylethanolamine/phosphatidyl-N-methylethanolamine N-methyltransferase
VFPRNSVTKELRTQFSSVALFLQEWLQYPRQIGAILPSSRNLSGAMAYWLPPEPDEFVLELGPGTGSVTQALVERGLRQDRLVAIEKSPKLAGLLRERFPRAHIITGDALHLDQLLRKHVRQLAWVGAVISSLPLRNFAPADGESLAKKILAILRPDGRWVQYSYYLGNGRPQGTACFQMLASDVVWWNLPPARVSVYQKQGSALRPQLSAL